MARVATERFAPYVPIVVPLDEQSIVVDIYMGAREPRIETASFAPGSIAGQVPCHECLGTGWWGYGPEEICNGPCVDCKGTGREWVGLI